MPIHVRYPEDPTGINPDNFISGEVHTLSDRQVRVIVPKHSPFFTKSLVIYDGLTMQPLVSGSDYRVPTISQELTLRYGESIADSILIENSQVSSAVRISYQCLGGDFQNNIDNIVNVYEALINDIRSVDWETGVYGKPSEFPPSPHPHWLADIYGFEPVVFQMERIAQAITMGNSPAYEMILTAIKNMVVSEAEVDVGKPIEKFVTLDRLIYALDKYNFNSMTITPTVADISNGKSQWFDVRCSNVPDEVLYYWTIEHGTTDVLDFEANSGLVSMVNGLGRIMIQATLNREAEEAETFRIQIRRNGIQGMVMATSRLMVMKKHSGHRNDSFLEAFLTCCYNSPRLAKTSKTHSVNRKTWTGIFN